jgi:hypothetical protein
VLILNVDKVACFDTVLEVLILKGVTLHKNCAKCDLSKFALILERFKLFRMNTSASVDSRGVAGVMRKCIGGFKRDPSLLRRRIQDRNPSSDF